MAGNEKLLKMKKFAEKYAEKSGYRLNPDPEILEMILEGLVNNKEEYGRQYCPCRSVSGDPEEDRKKICPCFWHHQEIKEDGKCHCQLFLAPAESD